jgi:hypothetical protein
VGWGYCKLCGAGYAVTPGTKGRCYDCERAKVVTQMILKQLEVMSHQLEALVTKVSWGAAVPPQEKP